MTIRAVLAGLIALVAASASVPAAAMVIREVVTPLGITAWLVEDKSVPVVTVSFSFTGGAAAEPPGQRGVSSLMAELLTDGAGTLDAHAFRQREEAAAASLGFSASLDRLNGSLRVLSANREEGFDLLRSALTEPRFDAGMLEQRRAQAIAGLNQESQRPPVIAERTMMAALFANHPYGANPGGTRETLQALKVEDIRSRAAALLVRRGLIVVVVGDIAEPEVASLLDRTFGTLPAGSAAPPVADWIPDNKARTTVVSRTVGQSAIRTALPAVGRDDPDWHAAYVMVHMLGGGGQQSRLFTEVRGRRGLAYSISAGLRLYRKASLLVVTTGSANERVGDTVRVIGAEMARLRSEGVTEQELKDAKTYLTGSLPVSLDSSRSVANLLHGLQVEGLPRDYLDKRAALIGAVRAEDVQRAARRLLRDDLVQTVVVGKPVGLPSDP
jgi:zinc protease